MVQGLYIASYGINAGTLLVSLGLMEILKKRYERVFYFRPIITDAEDKDVAFMMEHFSLHEQMKESYLYTVKEFEEAVDSIGLPKVLEKILLRYKALQKAYDFVLCEGLSKANFSATLDFDINTKIAKNLQLSFVGVLNAKGQTLKEIHATLKRSQSILERENVSCFATFVNRVDPTLTQKLQKSHNPMTFFLEEVPELNHISVGEVLEALNAKYLVGDDDALLREVKHSKIAAMHIHHFLDIFEDGDFIITPADRLEIILAALNANNSSVYPSISGILLSGKIDIAPNFLELLKGLPYTVVPILSTDDDTYTAAMKVSSVKARLTPNNKRKIALSSGLFSDNVDASLIETMLSKPTSHALTPIMFEYQLFDRARTNRKRIILPEPEDDRVLRACEIVMRRNVAEIILIGDEAKIRERAQSLGLDISDAKIINPKEKKLRQELIQKFYELRKAKGLSLATARDALSHNNYFATMLLQEGYADGIVSGASHTTADTVRPVLQIIKAKEGIKVISSVFLMAFDNRVLVYGDGAINQDPNAEELASIAIASAKTAQEFGITPRVAMLSYSTGDSGSGVDVEKVKKATQIAKSLAPELLIEGPIQYDAAIDPEVAKKKLPHSKVAGQATVFIFPDLNTGNNTYKAVQRSAKAVAMGPILQGLNKPVNDLSRGCSVVDIVNTIAITAIQAQKSDI